MSKTYKPLVVDNDLYGQNVLRADVPGLAVAFRPTITHTNRLSANKANSNQTVEVVYPIVSTLEGRPVSTDSWKATFKFSALQHIIDDATANEVIDTLIAYVNAHREAIIEGSKGVPTDLVV